MIVPFTILGAADGLPLAGIAPVFAFFKRHNVDGTITDLADPTITDKGGGDYEFTVDDSLLPNGSAIDYVIDCTDAASARYLEGHLGVFIAASGAVVDFFVFSGVTGALLTTATPTFNYFQRRNSNGSMTDLSGSAPSITHRGGGLYEFTINGALLTTDSQLRYVVDLGASSAARFISGSVDAAESTPSPDPIVYTGPSWADLFDGLRTWVVRSTGLTDGNVIWADQTGPRPTQPFATLKIGPLNPIGPVDEVADLYDAGRPAGEEIELRAQGVRRFHVTVQAFTPGVLDTTSAHALLVKAQMALALPTIRAALETAGVTVFDLGTVQNLSALKDVKFEGRALLEIGCYTLLRVSEFVTYIETVAVQSFLGPPESGTRNAIDIP